MWLSWYILIYFEINAFFSLRAGEGVVKTMIYREYPKCGDGLCRVWQ